MGTVTAASGTVAGLLGFPWAWTDPASGKDLMGALVHAGGFTSADTVHGRWTRTQQRSTVRVRGR